MKCEFVDDELFSLEDPKKQEKNLQSYLSNI